MNNKRDNNNNIVEVLEIILNNFNKNGIELTYLDMNKMIPEFYIKISSSKSLIDIKDEDKLKELLESTYAILWSLCYGKINSINRNYKIDLNYEII